MACANWLPELVIDQQSAFISGLYKIEASRYDMFCAECNQLGVGLQCMHGHCQTAFHPSCIASAVRRGRAFAAPLRVSAGWQWKLFCQAHSRLAAKNYEKEFIEALSGVSSAVGATLQRGSSAGGGDDANEGDAEDDDLNDGAASTAPSNHLDTETAANEAETMANEDGVGSEPAAKRFRGWRGLPLPRAVGANRGLWGDASGIVERQFTITEDEAKQVPSMTYLQQSKFWELLVQPFFNDLQAADCNWLSYLIERTAGDAVLSRGTASGWTTGEHDHPVNIPDLPPLTSPLSVRLGPLVLPPLPLGPADGVVTGHNSPATATPAAPSSELSDKILGIPIPKSYATADVLQEESALVLPQQRADCDDQHMDDGGGRLPRRDAVTVGISHDGHAAHVDISVRDGASDAVAASVVDWSALDEAHPAVVAKHDIASSTGTPRPDLPPSSAVAGDMVYQLQSRTIEPLASDEISPHVALLQAQLKQERSATSVRALQLAARVQLVDRASGLPRAQAGLHVEPVVAQALTAGWQLPSGGHSAGPGVTPAPGVECLPWQYPVACSDHHGEPGLEYCRIEDAATGTSCAAACCSNDSSTASHGPVTQRLHHIPPEPIVHHLREWMQRSSTWKTIVRHLHRGIRYHDATSINKMAKALPASWLVGAHGRSMTEAEAARLQGACCICYDVDSGPEQDMLIRCERCKISVHRRCYGVGDDDPCVADDQVPFLCQPCAVTEQASRHRSASKDGIHPPQCCLCPSTGGALLVTTAGTWVHAFCALWHPRSTNTNVVRGGPVQIDAMDSKARGCDDVGSSISEMTALMQLALSPDVTANTLGLLLRHADLYSVPHRLLQLLLGDTELDATNLRQARHQLYKNPQKSMSILHLPYTAKQSDAMIREPAAIAEAAVSWPSAGPDSSGTAATSAAPKSPSCGCCGKDTGHTVPCSHTACQLQFHPTCAWSAGLYMSITAPGTPEDAAVLAARPHLTTSAPSCVLDPAASFLYQGGGTGLRFVILCTQHDENRGRDVAAQAAIRTQLSSTTLPAVTRLPDASFTAWMKGREEKKDRYRPQRDSGGAGAGPSARAPKPTAMAGAVLTKAGRVLIE